MQTLYDSDFFCVMHMMAMGPDAPAGEPAPTQEQPSLIRHGFEIVDKRSGKEVYLDGSWAEMFQQRIMEWQRNTPSEEEVEDTLSQYAQLAHTPVMVH